MTDVTNITRFSYSSEFENVNDCVERLKYKIDALSLTLRHLIDESNYNGSAKQGINSLIWDLQQHVTALNNQFNC